MCECDLGALVGGGAAGAEVLGVDGGDAEGHEPREAEVAQLRHPRLLHVDHVLRGAGAVSARARACVCERGCVRVCVSACVRARPCVCVVCVCV